MFRVELRDGKALFYFASSRVDFRDLVRDLGRQRYPHRVAAAPGRRCASWAAHRSCGRELCCSTSPKFAPVSIKMAKHQNLA